MAHRPERQFATVLADLPGLSLSESDPAGATVVTGISFDSRDVRSGDLYAALPGASAHGADFVTAAIQSGAAAILTDAAGQEKAGEVPIPVVMVSNPREILGELSAKIYGDPGESMTLIGVTGTNGEASVDIYEGGVTIIPDYAFIEI